MSTRPLVLASASSARLRLLRSAGLDPVVRVSGVDEGSVVEPDARVLAEELAVRKAYAVADDLDVAGALVIGCDSVLTLDDEEVLGKPSSHDEAAARWRRMRGRDGVLVTGHCLLDTGTGDDARGVAETVVRFGLPTDAEVDAYIASGEPMHVAGAFTLDGRSGPFIDGVDGDPSNVIGLSLPLLRTLLAALDVRITDLWSAPR